MKHEQNVWLRISEMVKNEFSMMKNEQLTSKIIQAHRTTKFNLMFWIEQRTTRTQSRRCHNRLNIRLRQDIRLNPQRYYICHKRIYNANIYYQNYKSKETKHHTDIISHKRLNTTKILLVTRDFKFMICHAELNREFEMRMEI